MSGRPLVPPGLMDGNRRAEGHRAFLRTHIPKRAPNPAPGPGSCGQAAEPSAAGKTRPKTPRGGQRPQSPHSAFSRWIEAKLARRDWPRLAKSESAVERGLVIAPGYFQQLGSQLLA